ncbi:hypothetical protein GT037_003198 [Alternaria burnsii]|uniref:Uncharacterized protein n=1 Tax=Alternaria burnsii TaxID=1187904 RepID=A0A8H7EI18_9PLEO|nr:uncharacterized protein GT037_003198 [Alternaria burnsii]KAF7679450.1 hypothetical protein GT037_003198 [Alternaria burnsii]
MWHSNKVWYPNADIHALNHSAHEDFGTGPTPSRGCRRSFPWSTALPSAAKQNAVAEALIEGRRPEHKVFQFPVSRVATLSSLQPVTIRLSMVPWTAVLWNIGFATGGRVDECTSPFAVER